MVMLPLSERCTIMSNIQLSVARICHFGVVTLDAYLLPLADLADGTLEFELIFLVLPGQRTGPLVAPCSVVRTLTLLRQAFRRAYTLMRQIPELDDSSRLIMSD